MASARKCDRCGKYFDNSSHGFNHIVLNNLNSISDRYTKSLDLCPSCMDVLISWLQNKAVFAPLD